MPWWPKRVEDVAKDNGYSKFAFNRIINGTIKAQRPRELIASIVGKSVKDIWPEPAKGKENQKKSRLLKQFGGNSRGAKAT